MRSMKFAVAITLAGLALIRALPAGADAAGDPKAGKSVYEANCLLCHGANGRGDGPASAGLNPKPMNFHDASKMAKVDEATRIKAVSEGGAAVGLSSVMPAFKASLTPKQIRDVVAYVSQNLSR